MDGGADELDTSHGGEYEDEEDAAQLTDHHKRKSAELGADKVYLLGQPLHLLCIVHEFASPNWRRLPRVTAPKCSIYVYPYATDQINSRSIPGVDMAIISMKMVQSER